jgi:hypothetical protein
MRLDELEWTEGMATQWAVIERGNVVITLTKWLPKHRSNDNTTDIIVSDPGERRERFLCLDPLTAQAILYELLKR